MRIAVLLSLLLLSTPSSAALRVGTAITDVTPPKLPALVNGGMLTRSIDTINTPISARTLVLDDGRERIAIVVVDSCMISRDLIDDAKHLASRRTQIKTDRILISATHTHSAPAAMGCLGTSADPDYVPFLRERLAASIATAEKRLEPAEVGWATVDCNEFTAVRRWIRRPDRVDIDPFGNRTVRANMHAARKPDDVVGPSGPEDPELSLIAFRRPDGSTLAVLANFSMHYFSDTPISADYFGLFCKGLERELGGEEATPGNETPRCLALLSHGCSGDIWRRDYADLSNPLHTATIADYTSQLLAKVVPVAKSLNCSPVDSIAMDERRLPLRYRVPDQQRLAWAERVVEEMGDRPPKDKPEVYAREQLILHEWQQTEVVVQALRIGDIGIATTPNETYALTGLKIKGRSPLVKQMVIELANGGDGYIPPPEQHRLGGYNTWAARSAGLEVTAEPRIAEAALELLEQVTQQPRRRIHPDGDELTRVIAGTRPDYDFRLHETEGAIAESEAESGASGAYTGNVAYFLPGRPLGAADRDATGTPTTTSRAVHMAGGALELKSRLDPQGYAISLWIWNGMPLNARETTGWFCSIDPKYGFTTDGLHVGVTGGAENSGRLILSRAKTEPSVGTRILERYTWHHVLLVRNDQQVTLYLDGRAEAEVSAVLPSARETTRQHLHFGNRSDRVDGWEGRIDDVTVWKEPLASDTRKEILAAVRDVLARDVDDKNAGREDLDADVCMTDETTLPRQWQAGAAVSTITPTEPMWMSGYASRNHKSEGTLHPLFMKALAIEDPTGNRGILLTADLIGFNRSLADRIRREVSQRHRLPRESVILSASHTHTGPVVGRNLSALYAPDSEDQRQIDRYAKGLVETAVTLAGRALADLEPCRLEYGVGEATFAVNRRNNREADVPALRDEGRLAGPVDHSLPVLAAFPSDSPEMPKAVLFGYACHATVLSSYQWSGDWPGFAQTDVETAIPECVTLFFAGCGGDQNPLPRRSVELAKRYGTLAAEGVLRTLAEELTPITGTLRTGEQQVRLPFAELPTRSELEGTSKSSNRYAAARAQALLSELTANGKLTEAYDYPIGLWMIGDQLAFFALGGEVTVEYALRLRSEVEAGAVFVAAYCNDVMAYIPSERVLKEGGYEGGGSMVYYGLPSPWAAGIEEKIVSAARRLFARMAQATPASKT